MKPVAFEYIRPSDVEGALAAARQSADAKFIAGGQSLGPMVNLRLARPSVLVDISLLQRPSSDDNPHQPGCGLSQRLVGAPSRLETEAENKTFRVQRASYRPWAFFCAHALRRGVSHRVGCWTDFPVCAETDRNACPTCARCREKSGQHLGTSIEPHRSVGTIPECRSRFHLRTRSCKREVR